MFNKKITDQREFNQNMCMRYLKDKIKILKSFCSNLIKIRVVLWIRIRMDPELLPGSGSGIKVPDPAKVKEQINKTVNSGLFLLLDSNIE